MRAWARVMNFKTTGLIGLAVAIVVMVIAVFWAMNKPPPDARSAVAVREAPSAAPQVPPVVSPSAASPPAARASPPREAAAKPDTPDIGRLAATLAPQPGADAPAFDVARIEPSGDAVIAGRAAPGATVELLCDGQPCDRAVADQAGQFVMISPGLPAGSYALTLRTRRPDGSEVVSSSGVTVALAPRPPVVATPPTAPPEGAVTVADATVAAAGVASGLGAAPSQPNAAPAAAPDQATAKAAPEAVAREGAQPAAQPDAKLDTKPVAKPVTKPATKPVTRPTIALVSRGDSLWRISRMTYGDGNQYPVIFRANRGKIKNPDLIFPGQTFVLPRRR